MKIIDQTPFYDHETGEISVLDRGKAMMKYGSGWFKEIEAQKQIIAVMSKVLDRNYTLLRNFTLTELGASFPLILVGPTGIFVMYVTPLTGMFRARGDQWGTVSGNLFREEKPNLLTRTERMARAIQVYLQRHGYQELTSVEAILLCSDPAINVDSLRPIIRVVMRDALERFLVSITQSRLVLNQDAVYNVVEWLVNPSKPASPQPETPAPSAYEPAAFEPAASEENVSSETPVFTPAEPQPSMWDRQPADVPAETAAPAWETQPEVPVEPAPSEAQPRTRAPGRRTLTKGQWGFLIGLFVVWIVIIIIFLALVVRDQMPSLLGLLP